MLYKYIKKYNHNSLNKCEQIDISDIYQGGVYIFAKIGEWVNEGSYVDYYEGLYRVQFINDIYQGVGVNISDELPSFPNVNTRREYVECLIKEFEESKVVYPEWLIYYCDDWRAVNQFLGDYFYYSSSAYKSIEPTIDF